MRRLNGAHAFAFDAAGNSVALLATRTPVGDDTVGVLARWLGARRSASRADIYAEIVVGGTMPAARFWNPDGSEEAICGNALRCVPFVAQALLGAALGDRVEIALPQARATAHRDEDGTSSFSLPVASIGAWRLGADEVLVDCGTPHVVRLVADVRGIEIARLGNERATAQWINATFVGPGGRHRAIRTFERGAGETGSCGTGALSAFVALAHLAGDDSQDGQIELRFGEGEALTARRVEAPCAAIEVRGRCTLIAHEALAGAVAPRWAQRGIA